MTSLLNALIGEYRIVESLGAGGMGEVYKAVHTHLGRVIAIKVLAPDLADGPALQRFYNEASIQASLKHPSVAEYLGFYEYQGRPCILMEYVDGETLAGIMRRQGGLSLQEAVRVLRDVAGAAAHFHALGVVHRDLKTSNVKIDSAGKVKILDFGIAHHQRSDRLTRVGAVVGTTDALAPEQVRGDPIGLPTDVWQLGVLFYELLTEHLPFEANTTHETYVRILSAEYPPVQHWQPGIPPGLAKIVTRCLQKEMTKRYPSAAELYDALCEWERSAIKPAIQGKPKNDYLSRKMISAQSLGLIAVLLVLGAAILAIRNCRDDSAKSPEEVITMPEQPGTAQPQVMAELKTITVDTADGAAKVFQNGKIVGTTPFQVRVRAGEAVSLILKRDGCEDKPVQFEATERHTYTYTLEPRKGR